MLALSLAPNEPAMFVVLVPTGAITVYFGAVANSHMQALSRQEFRGRVMSIYSLLGLGTTVIGGPLVGAVSQQWNPRVAVGLAGVATIATAASLAFVRVSSRQPIAVEVAADIDAATI
jgi:MFS family permease